jgi:hypothetical protein
VTSRTRAGLALVLLYALASSAAWIRLAATAPARAGSDEISSYERRFLPPHGVVGYVGDPDPEGATPAQRNATSLLHFKRYLLAQYALAPVVLIESTEPELVVGNFDPGSRPSLPRGFQIERDFGNGLVLLRRRP